MSAQTVDVLAVMDHAALELDAVIFRADNPRPVGFDPPDVDSLYWRHEIIHAEETRPVPDELREARAAVAELIEAARVVTVRTAAGHFTADARDLAALAAALARVIEFNPRA